TSAAVEHQPHAAVAAANRIFVGNEFGESVSVISGGRVIGRIGGFLQPGGLAAVGPAANPSVAVVDVRANTVSLIDARTLRLLAKAPAGAGPTHAVADTHGYLYVVDTRGNAVTAFATRPQLRELNRVTLAGTPYGVAIDPA